MLKNKKCTKCKKTKKASDFYKTDKIKSGLTSACKVCSRKINKEWHDQHPEYRIKKLRKYISSKDNYKKHLARNTLHYHLRVGHIIKEPCYKCKSFKVEGHHPDHSKPLDVIWTCKEHHLLLHI